MKYKILFLLAWLPLAVFSQEEEKEYYCEVYCSSTLGTREVTPYIDFGDKFIGKKNFANNDDCIPVDKEGKKMKFKSFAGILNWMADRGWKVIAQNFGIYGVKGTAYFLMSKKTTRENIKKDISLDGDLKK